MYTIIYFKDFNVTNILLFYKDQTHIKYFLLLVFICVCVLDKNWSLKKNQKTAPLRWAH